MADPQMQSTSSDHAGTDRCIPGWSQPEAYDYSNYENSRERRRDWDGNARIYEWDGEHGDVGPEFPELEVELFGPPAQRNQVKGIDFSKIEQIEVIQEGPIKIDPIASFDTAGLHPVMLRNVQLSGFDAPTPIQKFTLPAIGQGYDVIGIAQTGSGKTAAYMIPILNKLMGKAKKLAAPRPNPATFKEGLDQPVRAEPLVCVVAPTRELAIQIFNEARKFCYRTMLRPVVLYGGGPITEQLELLRKGCDVLIATPGRLVDFIKRPNDLTLRRLKYMVIDEADEMLQADWQEEFGQILGGGDQDEGNVRYMLFSATFPKAARELAGEYLAATHVRFRVGRAGSSHENIRQVIMEVDHPLKKQVLLQQLKSIPPCRTIIFVNSKRVADEIDDFLFNMGLPCTSMHADRTQLEREASMRAFRAGKAPILIATGVSARGIDVRNILHVINYDLPSTDHGGIEEYTHRIGRTGRAGHRGLATSFFTDRDEQIASVLTRTLLETKQAVPDFLKHHIPHNGILTWESEEQDVEPTTGIDGGEGWGTDLDVAAGNDGNGWSGGSHMDTKLPEGDGSSCGAAKVDSNNGWGPDAAAPTW